MFEYKFENMTQFGKTLSAIQLQGSLVEVGSLYHHKLSSFLCELPYLQADVALVDRDGGQHPVHSFLLVAKFPIFRGLPEHVFKMVTMAGMIVTSNMIMALALLTENKKKMNKLGRD